MFHPDGGTRVDANLPFSHYDVPGLEALCNDDALPDATSRRHRNRRRLPAVCGTTSAPSCGGRSRTAVTYIPGCRGCSGFCRMASTLTLRVCSSTFGSR